MSEMWVAINMEDEEFPRLFGPFKSDDAAEAYCREQEWESWGAQRVDAP